MIDRADPDRPRDELDDDRTVAGSDEVLAEIRRHAAARLEQSTPEGAPASATMPSDDETVADHGTFEEIRAAIEGARARPPQQDEFDDPTTGAPHGHPSRAEHPFLGGGPALGPASGSESAAPGGPAGPARSPTPRILPVPSPPPPASFDTPAVPAAPPLEGSSAASTPWSPPPRGRQREVGSAPASAPQPRERTRGTPAWVAPLIAAAVVIAAVALFVVLR